MNRHDTNNSGISRKNKGYVALQILQFFIKIR